MTEIEERLEALYGPVDWPGATGVIHVAAIGAVERVVIIPGRAAPASETDRFALGAARARADAIVTTGAILRAEPGLRHEASDDPGENRAFEAWRRIRLGREMPPMRVVLTASGRIPLEHPAIRDARAGFIWTTARGAARLGDRVGALAVLCGDAREEGIHGAVREARARPGVETVSIEAGPSASAALYRPEPRPGRAVQSDRPAIPTAEEACDELLLSCFEGELAEPAKGPAFPSSRRIEAHFRTPPHETPVVDGSGRWVFARYRRIVSGEALSSGG